MAPCCLAVAGLLWVFASPGVASPPALPLVRVVDVALGGRATRLDYESVDAARHRLFIAHLGDSAVIVFDTQERRVVARIPGISDVHGVLAIPELGIVYASATGTNEVVAIDESTLKITARMPGGVYPDGMAYASDVGKLYVSDEHGGTDTVIDVRRNRALGAVPLGGDVGNTQYDPVSKHIFVNVQTRQELVEIDPTTDKIVTRTRLPQADSNHGLLIEPEQRRAFIACEGNHKLLVLDLNTRRTIDSFDVGAGPDVLAYDAALRWLYVAAESGVVSVFELADGRLSKRGEGLLGPNAHVVAVDPISHQSFYPLKDVDGSPVLRVMAPTSQERR
jgi:DNA-binding beta-propeller fold protein YncE